MQSFKVGSLFAGVGGICLGFKNAKFENLDYSLSWANEIDEYACETYRLNFNHTLLEGDINKILDNSLCSSEEKEKYEKMHQTLLNNKIDLLTAGFPCQAFSIAGNRKGFEDERGHLFLSIIKLVKEISVKNGKPRVLFLENVKNLLSHDKGNTYKTIKNEIEKLGYFVKEKVFNTMHFSNLPQNRERIYILCFRDKADYNKFDFDKIEKENRIIYHAKDRKNQVENIVNYNVESPAKYYYTKEKYPNYFQEPVNNKKYINLNEQITEKYQFYQLRRGLYVRKNQSNVCPTLTANMGTGGHNVPLIIDNFGIRKLLPAETFRLQGFPVGKTYKLPIEYKGKPYSSAKLYKQAGNAVSVPVIQLIATELLKVFKENNN